MGDLKRRLFRSFLFVIALSLFGCGGGAARSGPDTIGDGGGAVGESSDEENEESTDGASESDDESGAHTDGSDDAEAGDGSEDDGDEDEDNADASGDNGANEGDGDAASGGEDNTDGSGESGDASNDSDGDGDDGQNDDDQGSGGTGDENADGNDVNNPRPNQLYISLPADVVEYQNLITVVFPALRDEIPALGLTPFEDAITYGSVQYDGHMNLVFIATPVTNLMGDATLTVDLSSGETLGNASGFMGVVLDDDGASQYVDYIGDIAITDGILAQTTNDEAAYSVRIDGALENGISTYGVSGQLNGFIFGSEADALRVIGTKSFFNDDITLTVDGVEITDGTAGIWATKQ